MTASQLRPAPSRDAPLAGLTTALLDALPDPPADPAVEPALLDYLRERGHDDLAAAYAVDASQPPPNGRTFAVCNVIGAIYRRGLLNYDSAPGHAEGLAIERCLDGLTLLDVPCLNPPDANGALRPLSRARAAALARRVLSDLGLPGVAVRARRGARGGVEVEVPVRKDGLTRDSHGRWTDPVEAVRAILLRAVAQPDPDLFNVTEY